jgi:hypothetical protein
MTFKYIQPYFRFFLLFSGLIWSAELTNPSITADKATVKLGEPIFVTVQVTYSSDGVVRYNKDKGDYLPFEIYEFGDVEQISSEGNGLHRYEFVIEAALFDTTDRFFPPVRLTGSYITADTTYNDSIATGPVFVRLQKTMPDTMTTLHEGYGLIGTGISWWPYLLGLILLVVLGYFLWRRYLHQQASQFKDFTGNVVRESAEELALKRLHALAKADWLLNQKYKRWYSEISEIAREYIENTRPDFAALEMTTTEIRPRLSECFDQKDEDFISRILQKSDLVKFAKYFPENEPHDDYLEAMTELMNRLKLDREKAQSGEEDDN